MTAKSRKYDSNGNRLNDPDALMAPVCVCLYPKPDPIGECEACGRPHHADNVAFMAIRHVWRTSGIDCEPDDPEAVDGPSVQLSMFPAIAPHVPWPAA